MIIRINFYKNLNAKQNSPYIPLSLIISTLFVSIEKSIPQGIHIPMDKNKTFDKKSIDDIKLQKMIFIYNALSDGWTVKPCGDDEYDFIKSTKKIKRKMKSLKDFINQNLTLEK